MPCRACSAASKNCFRPSRRFDEKRIIFHSVPGNVGLCKTCFVPMSQSISSNPSIIHSVASSSRPPCPAKTPPDNDKAFSPVAAQLPDGELLKLLENPSLAIGWALEHLPHQLNEFFTEYKADQDRYLWATNMTGWIEHSRSE